MTQEPNPGTSPGDETTAWTPPQPEFPAPADQPADATPAADQPAASLPVESAAAPPPPGAAASPFEPAEAGANPAAQAVVRDGTFGAEAPAGRRASGIRWAIALAGVAVVVGVMVAIIALAGGRPTPSIALGYMPADSISYAEYRFDLPGDQRQRLGTFLQKFPGFDDAAILDTKINEVLDRILAAATNGEQTFSADIDPWFGRQIAVGAGAISGPDAFSGMAGPFGGGQLFIVTIKDPTLAANWVREILDGNATESPYAGATVFTAGSEFGSAASIAINDEVMIAGGEADVRAAIDSKGDGDLVGDPEFKAAFETVRQDYVSFSYIEYRSLVSSMMGLMGTSGLDQTTVDDELLLLVPAWNAGTFWIEDDALVGESVFPSIDFGFKASNHKGTLAGHVPPSTIAFAESHDVGSAVTTFIGRLRAMPDLREAFGQIDQSAGMIGGVNGVIGWWGDAAVAVSKMDDGTIGGGLLIVPTDVEAANRTFVTLRSFVALAGGGAGLAVRDVPHGDATITVVDFTEALGPMAGLPPGYKAEIAYTVTNEVVAVGYGEAWVAAVLDAGPGPSLADDDRFKNLVGRVGEDNMGLSFVDVGVIREIVEPLIREQIPAEQWSFYENEIKPYVLPFDALISGSRKDGDLDRLPQAITVK